MRARLAALIARRLDRRPRGRVCRARRAEASAAEPARRRAPPRGLPRHRGRGQRRDPPAGLPRQGRRRDPLRARRGVGRAAQSREPRAGGEAHRGSPGARPAMRAPAALHRGGRRGRPGDAAVHAPGLSAVDVRERDGTVRRRGGDGGRGPARGRHAARGGHQLESRPRGRRRREPAQPRRRRARAHVLVRPRSGRRPRAGLHQGHARRGHPDLAQALPRPRIEPARLPCRLHRRDGDLRPRRGAPALPRCSSRKASPTA